MSEKRVEDDTGGSAEGEFLSVRGISCLLNDPSVSVPQYLPSMPQYLPSTSHLPNPDPFNQWRYQNLMYPLPAIPSSERAVNIPSIPLQPVPKHEIIHPYSSQTEYESVRALEYAANELKEEEEEQRRLERNRLIAKRSRLRKKEWSQTLHEQYLSLRDKIAEEEKELQELNDDSFCLMTALLKCKSKHDDPGG